MRGLGLLVPCLGVVLSLPSLGCSEQGAPLDLRAAVSAADEPLGARPAMGWNSFDVLATSHAGYGLPWLTEDHLRQVSDVLAARLQPAGYQYINVDSGWSSGVDGLGLPVPDAQRFSHGIDALAAYVHARGQKLGIYGVVGLPADIYGGNYPIPGTNCHTQDIARQPLTLVPNGWNWQYELDWSNPCSQAYYNAQAARFASWGVDLVKIDGTTADTGPDINAWQKAISATGRPMWFTVSAWPVPLALGAEIRHAGQGVRVDTDIDCYCSTLTTWTASTNQRWNDLPNWLPYVGPGHFPDFDSMPISNNTGQAVQDGLNDNERQSVMSFWSLASSPLWIGGDIWWMDDTAQKILTNPEVVAVDQAAVMPERIAGGSSQIWKKAMPDGSTVVGLFNLGGGSASITVDYASLGLGGDASVRDLVARADLGTFTGSFSAANIPAHGSRLVQIVGRGDSGLSGYTFCASEYQNCALSGTMDVAYGAQGSYVFKSGLSGTIGCGNATFGSDPAYGWTKGCYTRPHAGGGPAGFTWCASEYGSCSPSGVVDVAYGAAAGSWVYKSAVTGSFACGNATFGSDPAYGWTKGCYTRPAGGGVAYEAEAATVSGNAKVTSCSGCAGGKKVGWLGAGAGNRVVFTQVDVAQAGDHTLFVHAASADPRRFDVRVNGGSPVSVAVQSGDWNRPASASVSVHLERGLNSIAIGNDGDWAPDLDRIVVW
jgi:hypothetical protein